MPTRPVQAITAAVEAATFEELIRVRWAVAGAYLIAASLAHLGLVATSAPLPTLGAAAIMAVSNAALQLRARRLAARGATLALLLFDALLLTAVLLVTGGASNPLTAMYLVQVGLAALLLRGPWAWVFAALTSAAFGVLFLYAQQAGHGMHQAHGMDPAHGTHPAHAMHGAGGDHAGAFDEHLEGMWLAFTLTGVLIAYFVTRLAGQLASARTRAMRAERVASLASMAAGTSHQLGTPLASILLAATEMQRALDGQGPADLQALRGDAVLVGEQVRRCRTILDVMLAEAGEMIGEAPVEVTARTLVDDVLAGLREEDRRRVVVQLPADLPPLRVPPRVTSQALQNLVQNAIDASSRDANVELTAQASEWRVTFVVTDHGVGMTPEALGEAMEPFVSSKLDGGLGLGLFLARALAERLGGSLSLASTPGQGTVARFELRTDAVGTV